MKMSNPCHFRKETQQVLLYLSHVLCFEAQCCGFLLADRPILHHSHFCCTLEVLMNLKDKSHHTYQVAIFFVNQSLSFPLQKVIFITANDAYRALHPEVDS